MVLHRVEHVMDSLDTGLVGRVKAEKKPNDIGLSNQDLPFGRDGSLRHFRGMHANPQNHGRVL